MFDFDDACYLWYVSDIAIPFYYAVLSAGSGIISLERENFAARFLSLFLAGYLEETELPEDWNTQFHLLLRLRDVTLYSVLHKKIAAKDRDQKIAQLMKRLRSRIEDKKPIAEGIAELIVT
ncbi:hypothetical protein [Sediminibacillus albus]|uniref:hypothetical protein n=1 Tax=Sediminibacillus albus TaxID=407036 RepID=UPI000B87DA38|nr:hypothetical protein [Sediminibacillus albus]